MKLLTIAIPSFNRSSLLENQLAWLAQAIQGCEADCEILVSDNCSTDNTSDIVRKWQAACPDVSFKSHRNSENIGVMRNIAYCLQNATSEYVWVIGDDDDIRPDTLRYVVDSLKKDRDIKLMTLNYSLFDVVTNKTRNDSRFVISHDQIVRKGLTTVDLSGYPMVLGMGFMSAQIYHTTTVQAAMASWPSSLSNLEVQIYWGAFCARQGTAKITKNVYVQYNCGDNTLSKPKNWFKCFYHDAPIVYLKMLRIGYSQEFMKNLVAKVFFKKNEFKAIAKGSLKWPNLGMNVIKNLGILLIACNMPTKNQVSDGI
jgi:abequosyltransferase